MPTHTPPERCVLHKDQRARTKRTLANTNESACVCVRVSKKGIFRPESGVVVLSPTGNFPLPPPAQALCEWRPPVADPRCFTVDSDDSNFEYRHRSVTGNDAIQSMPLHYGDKEGNGRRK